MIRTTRYLNRIIFPVLGVGLVAYGLWLLSGEPRVGTGTPANNAATLGVPAESSAPALVKVPFKDMRVGTRVPAFNPEVSAAERQRFTEPNWYRWMKLKLEMSKPDGMKGEKNPGTHKFAIATLLCDQWHVFSNPFGDGKINIQPKPTDGYFVWVNLESKSRRKDGRLKIDVHRASDLLSCQQFAGADVVVGAKFLANPSTE